jgi:aminopeptidase YwaD
MKRCEFLLLIFFASLSLAHAQDQELKERLRAHVRFLTADSLEGRGLGTAGSILVRDYLIQQFSDAGIKPFGESYVQPFMFRLGVAWIPGENIIGYVEGSDPVLKKEFVLIGAHYDHLGYKLEHGNKVIYPGADDNASGVASILEIGRYFSENPQLLKRSLLIAAFDAEESGLHGSRYLANNLPEEASLIKMMFSLDMVGMYSDFGGMNLIGMGTLSSGEGIATSVAGKRNFPLKKSGERIVRNTDTAPFGDLGIPAAHAFTGTKSPYHKPGDTYDLLDYEGMAIINYYLIDLITELSGTEELLPAKRFAKQSTRGGVPGFQAGWMVSNGSGYHRYQEEFYRANSSYNLNTGLFLSLPLGKTFTLEQEFLYDLNGSKINGGNFYRHSITLPLNLQVGTPRSRNQDVRFFIFGGGYYRYSFAGTSAGVRIDFVNEFDPQEWGYQTGTGMEIFRFRLSFTNRRALTSLLRNGPADIRDSNSMFTFSYTF